MKRGELALISWVVVSLVPILPVIFGPSFDAEYAAKSGAFLLSRAWTNRVAVLGVGCSLPMFVDLYLDTPTTKSFTFRFWTSFTLITCGLVASIAIIIADALNVSDNKFVELTVCTMMCMSNLIRGTLCSFMYRDDSPRSMRILSNCIFLGALLTFWPRILNYYYPNPEREAFFGTLEALIQIFTGVASYVNLKNLDPFKTENFSDIRFSAHYTIFAAINVMVWVFISLVAGCMIPSLVILFAHVNILAGFFFIGRRKRDENARMGELLAAKREFVRYVAHEMRTPLNVSIIGLRMALEQVRQRRQHGSFNFPLLEETLDDSCKAVEEAGDTLNEMLLFDKIESGKFVLEPERVRIQELIYAVFRSFFLQAQQKNVAYAIDIPSTLQGVFIHADKKKISQVLRNFISNALKFTPDGGRVTVRACLLPSATKLPAESGGEPAQDIHIEVVDTGVGIESQNLPKLFHQVVQFNAAKLQNGGGSGLGLTIAKAIMDAHGGTVGVKSDYGHGSTFYLEMVAEVDPNDVEGPVDIFQTEFFQKRIKTGEEFSTTSNDDEASISDKGEETVSKPTAKSEDHIKRILIVDDSHLNLKMMKRLSNQFASEVLTAVCGADAVTIVSESMTSDDLGIDMVLTDFSMPGMNGVELTATLRAMGYVGFISLITGMEADESGMMTNFHRSGGNMILPKPIRVDSITRLVLSCIESKIVEQEKK